MNEATRPSGEFRTPIRVLLVDDQRPIREWVARLLGRERRLAVVGEAGDRAAGVELALRLRPDVVLTDYRMPRLDGAEATRRILAGLSRVRVVVMSGDAGSDAEAAALAAGAAEFPRKPCTPAELLGAVRRAGDANGR